MSQQKPYTGNALLIHGCRCTDFQSGDAGTLFNSINQCIFTLPDEALIYLGHGYQGRRVSNLVQEKGSACLADKTREEYIALINALNLPKPKMTKSKMTKSKMISAAVPENRKCGVGDEGVVQG